MEKSKAKKENNKKKEKEASNVKVTTKPIKQFFSLSSYEEISKQRKNKNQDISNNALKTQGFEAISNKTNIDKLTGRDLIQVINSVDVHSFMNEDFYQLFLFLHDYKLSKQRKCCEKIIKTLSSYIKKAELNSKFLTHCKKVFDRVAEIIRKITFQAGGIENTLNYIERLFSELFYFIADMSLTDIKNVLLVKLEEYYNIRLSKSKEILVNIGISLVKPNDKILVYGLNSYFKNIFLEATEKQVSFSILYIALGNDQDKIEKDIAFLAKLGVPVTFSYIISVSCVINSVTKVFLRAKSMLSNGSFIGEIGNSLIANIANNFKKPVIVFCESFKFWDRIILDSLSTENVFITKGDGQKEVARLGMIYDVTPSRVLNMVVCEMGYIPPSSVKVVIREYVCDEIEIKC